MATTLDKYLEELDVIIKDLKRIKHDLETAKSHSISLVVNVSVLEDVTLEDLYNLNIAQQK